MKVNVDIECTPEEARVFLGLPNVAPLQAAMLDHLLKGRFIMGISPGGLMSDAEVFGNFGKDRTAMFVEGIDMVLKIWEGTAPYNLKGNFWEVSTQRTMIPEIGQGTILRPFQKPYPQIVGTAVAPHSQGVAAMGERGWQPISAKKPSICPATACTLSWPPVMMKPATLLFSSDFPAMVSWFWMQFMRSTILKYRLLLLDH